MGYSLTPEQWPSAAPVGKYGQFISFKGQSLRFARLAGGGESYNPLKVQPYTPQPLKPTAYASRFCY